MKYQKDGRHNKEQLRDWTLRTRYGIGVEQYERMLVEQAGLCATCPAELNEDGRRLCVDHDHVTQKVRGLLCGRCNRALGLLDDDLDRVLSLAMYLLEHNG